MGGFWRSLALACSLSPLVVADPAPIPSLELVERQTNNTAANASAATWIYQGGPGGGRGDRDGDGQGPPPGRGPPEGVDVGRGGGPFGNVTFSITVNPDNDDMWFRIAAPAMYSWIGFAAGTEMASTKAFIMAWEGDREDSITLATRGACDKCEPKPLPHFGISTRDTPSTDAARIGIRDGMYFVSGFIANGTRRAGIDPRAISQPFIWAVGQPGHRPRSDSPEASLKMHSRHGRFALDMTKAHGTSLPAFATTQNGVAQQGGVARSDEERGSTAHAVMMCGGFVVLLPLGIVLLKLTSVKAHMWMQAVGLIVITIGWVTGFVISGRYQRSRNFDSTHQIIGIVVYLLLLAQFTTGFLHHRIWLKTQQPTWLIKPHKFGLGGIVLALGIINCAIGFRFANDHRYNMIFVPVVIVIIVLLVASVVFQRFRQRKKRAAQGNGASYPNMFTGQHGQPEGYRAPSGSQVPPAQGYYGAGSSNNVGASWDQRSDVELNKMGPPPSYSQEPQKPREMI